MTTRNSDTLARFAMHDKCLNTAAARRKLFVPNRDLNLRLSLSVFDVGGLTCKGIRKLGIGVAKEIAKKQSTSRHLYGWGEIDACAVLREANLQIERDDNPPRHANIVGWPSDAEERKYRQQLLGQLSRPVRLDPPVSVP